MQPRSIARRRRAAFLGSASLALVASGVAWVAPAQAGDWHDGWCAKGEGLAVAVDWRAATDGSPAVPGNVDTGVLVRCLVGAKFDTDDARADVVRQVGLQVASSGGLVTTINGIKASSKPSGPTWWYHTGTPGAWAPKQLWVPVDAPDNFVAIVLSTDANALPPVVPKFADPGPGPSDGPSGDGPSGSGPSGSGPSGSGPSGGGPSGGGPSEPGPSDGPSNSGPSNSGPSNSGPTNSGPSGSGPSDGSGGHDQGPTAPDDPGSGPARPAPRDPSPRHSTVTDRPSAGTAVAPRRGPTGSTEPREHASAGQSSATPSAPTPSPSASSPGSSASAVVGPQSSPTPVWGREDQTRTSLVDQSGTATPSWAPVVIALAALGSLVLAMWGLRAKPQSPHRDEEPDE